MHFGAYDFEIHRHNIELEADGFKTGALQNNGNQSFGQEFGRRLSIQLALSLITLFVNVIWLIIQLTLQHRP